MRTDSPTIARQTPAGTVGGVADAGLLAEITAGLATGDDLHALLDRFLRPIVQVAGAQAGAVRVLCDDGLRMQLVSGFGLPQGVLDAERCVEHDCGVCGRAALDCSPAWADDLRPCSRRNRGAYFGSGCTRVLAVPLQHRGKVLGVYNLFYAAGSEPGEGVLALLRSVGELLGLAMVNARLERENLHAAVMDERRMMAAEVHDSVAQALTFAKMRLPLLHDAMLAHDDMRALAFYGDIRRAMGEAHTSLREILAEFRTRIDPEGLLHALRAATDGFEARTGIAFELVDRVGMLWLTPERQAHAFHVAQEALANVVRHSMAHHVCLSIELSDGTVHILIEDDGVGVSQPAAEDDSGAHFGLDIMRARARRLGGEIEIRSVAAQGTRVHLRFPAEPGAPGQESS